MSDVESNVPWFGGARGDQETRLTFTHVSSGQPHGDQREMWVVVDLAVGADDQPV